MHRRRSRLSSLVAPSALALSLFALDAALAGAGPAPAEPADRSLEVVAVDPFAPRTLYALSRQTLNGRPVRGDLYKSQDGGASWGPASRGFDGEWGGVRSLVADPDRPGAFFAVSRDGGLYRSADGGGLWEKIGETGARDASLSLVPGKPPVLFVHGADGSLERSVDEGGSWEVVFESSLGVGKVFFDPADRDRLFLESASAPSGLLASQDGGESWEILLPTLALGRLHLLAVTATRPTTLWASNENGLFHSRDGGTTWQATGLAGSAGTDANGGGLPFAVDPRAPEAIYAVPAGLGVMFSPDGGATWEIGGAGLTGRKVRGLWVDRQTRNVFAQNDAGIVFESRVGASRWLKGSLDGVLDQRDLLSGLVRLSLEELRELDSWLRQIAD